MAAKKKRKPKAKKTKKKSALAKKPAVGKKRAKKKVGKKIPSRPKVKATKPAGSPSAATPAPAAPAAPPGEQRIGVVTHYFGHLAVAVVHLEEGVLRAGDTIHIKGHTSDFRQRVESMQIEHASVAEARAGQDVGLKVGEHAREHDAVYKVIAS